MADYCRSDVDILRRACMKYRALLMGATCDEGCPQGIDPLTQVIIASVAMTIFRAKFLPETWTVELSTGTTITATRLNVLFKVDNILLNTHLEPSVNVVSKKIVEYPIALLPSHGYTRQDQYSQISIQWLEWQMLNEQNFIRHALNHEEGEKVVDCPDGQRYRLDGYCKTNNTVYEYIGCFFHVIHVSHNKSSK